jgi:hypothetical protein
MTANPLPHPWQPMDTFPDDDREVWVAHADEHRVRYLQASLGVHRSAFAAWAPYEIKRRYIRHPFESGWSPSASAPVPAYTPTLPLDPHDVCIEHQDSDGSYAWGALVETTGLGYYGHMFAWAVVHALVHLGSQMTWRTPEPPLPWPWKRADGRFVRRDDAFLGSWMAWDDGRITQAWNIEPGDIICEREGRWADVAPPHPAHVVKYGIDLGDDR